MAGLTSESESETRSRPVGGAERITAVDVLRGFAIFGILLINIYGFSGQFLSPQSHTDSLDHLVVIVVIFLAQAKFYSLFSFLFGWGMSIQLERALNKGASFVRLYLRRMLVLLLIGLIHGLFIWSGDILTAYAVLGTGLLLFRKSSPKTLLAAVALFLLSSIFLVLPGSAMDQVREFYSQVTAFMRAQDIPQQSILGHGTYGQINQRRMAEFISSQSWVVYWLGNVFAMMLLGLYAGKRRILQDVEGHLSLIRRTNRLGLVVGLLLNAIFVWTMLDSSPVSQEHERFVRVTVRTIGAPALMLFYASGLVLLMRRESWRRRLAPLAPVGRMALSNYLFQSLLATLLFYGYGLGLYGEITPTVALIVVVVIFLLQIRVSGWWMERFRFGPAEWVWRSLTYGRFQPLRRQHLIGPPRAGAGRWSLPRLAGGLNPIFYLVVVWVLLIVWAGALYSWSTHLSAQAGDEPISLFSSEAPAVTVSATLVRPVAAGPEAETLATPVARPLAYDPSPPAAVGDVEEMIRALDVEQAIDHVQVLAGPDFAGRLAGSAGGTAAGDYIAEMFDRYGLQPAGQAGTFFQSFPITYTILSGVPSLKVELPDGGEVDAYQLYHDFVPVITGYSGGGQGAGPVHWVDRCRAGDFADLDLVGKIVFCKPEPGTEALVASGRLAREYGASGLLLLTEAEDRPADFGVRHEEVWLRQAVPTLRVYRPLVDDLLAGSGLSVEELLNFDDPLELATRASLRVDTSESTRVDARNVLGFLPGRDPQYAHEVVIVGAHYDHMGQGPDATLWPGANDNASGTAAVLEIARSWQELGYVPRQTVVFAAWDAEEWGLLGSQHYVEHPPFPLENTIASIQMDMVGNGPDSLAIGGHDELARQQLHVAEQIGLEATLANLGRSDHMPFLEAGVPATLLIWRSDDEPDPYYHRPADLPRVIEPDKLAAVLRVAGTTLLDLTESEPAIEQLVARRAKAALENDLAAFLSTSSPDQTASDNRWLADLSKLDPRSLAMSVEALEFHGDEATAEVSIEIVDGADSDPLELDQLVRFSHGDDGWRWAGPALNWYVTPATTDVFDDPLIQVAVGSTAEITLEHESLAHQVAAQYVAVAHKLGLPETADIRLMLLPDSEAIRFSTALSLPDETPSWVEPGLVKIVGGQNISQSLTLQDTLVQLVLADAGLAEASAPWLWHGLPIAWRADSDLKSVHGRYLPALAEFLGGEEDHEAGSWAAVEYLIQKVGWQGTGQFIRDLGLACAKYRCDTPAGVDQAMTSALQVDTAAFHRSWQEFWTSRLDEVQVNLDRLLFARAEAVLAGDEASFLATVDPNDPYLLSSEQLWFADLSGSDLAELRLTSSPVALFENGDVLAEVTYIYRASEDEAAPPGEVTMKALFTAVNDGFRWAGVAGQTLASENFTIRYPDGREELASALLQQAERSYGDLARTLYVVSPLPLVVDLYPDHDSFRVAVGLAEDTAGWLPAWSEPGSGIKMQIRAEDAVEAYRAALVNQLVRQLLYQKGITSEWLLKGISAQLSIASGSRELQRSLATTLAEKTAADSGFREAQFLSMAPDEKLSGAAWLSDTAKAWDSTSQLIASEGWPTVLDFMEQLATSGDLPAAFSDTFGRPLADFEREWLAGVAGGHVAPDWVAAASLFDGQAALAHVAVLGDKQSAGRQAGTPGAEIAAGFIARRFADYGLVPAGDLHGASYYQSFPITLTVPTGQPTLELFNDPQPYEYRQDFLSMYATEEPHPVAGELVWLAGSAGQTLDLSGKIAVMMPGPNQEDDLNLALSQKASGLILLGNKRDDVDLYAKRPLTPANLAPIPVIELTLDGKLRWQDLLELSYEDTQDLPSGAPLGAVARLHSSATTKGQLPSTNVLGLLPGSDPLLSQQTIIIGAHYDHVGDDPPGDCDNQVSDCSSGTRYSGLNDNASGVGVLLEIARLWQDIGYRPKHSVLFAAWGAQEIGQLGSAYYVQAPTLPLSNTVAMWQLDGLGGGEGFYPGLHGEPGLDDLPLLYTTAAAGHLGQKVIQTTSSADSDHLSFRAAGLPSLLLSWRLAGEDNLPDGLANGVSPERLEDSGRLITLALMMLAR